jgi:hypothetical protein
MIRILLVALDGVIEAVGPALTYEELVIVDSVTSLV